MAKRKYEFKQDRKTDWLKKIYMTRLQRLRLLKWLLIALCLVLLQVIQDVIMSRARIFGASTDLVPAAILLITVMMGAESGSIFVLTASTLYYFTGSSPGAFCIAAMTVLGLAACLFRQAYWRRSFSTTVLCAALAVMLYEITVFVAGIFLKLTIPRQLGIFLMTGLLSSILLLPMYPLFARLSKIGGELWKE